MYDAGGQKRIGQNDQSGKLIELVRQNPAIYDAKSTVRLYCLPTYELIGLILESWIIGLIFLIPGLGLKILALAFYIPCLSW